MKDAGRTGRIVGAALLLAVLLLLAALLVPGCKSYPVNDWLRKGVDPGRGYRYANLDPGEGNTESNFLLLTFSGGGTRAAALSYGVLSVLRRAHPRGEADATTSSLLEEVDVISSVSGGSFAAAYYGLFGPQRFFSEFESAVLERKIERDLILRILAPWNWPALLSYKYGRSDLAARYYDEEIFEGRTYGSMLGADGRGVRPFIILNATDMSLGAQFPFTQESYDRLCSDLSGVKVARGVTASSAFPVAFTPLTIRSYPKRKCGERFPRWVEVADAPFDFQKFPRRFNRAANWRSYADEKRKFVHVIDGGIADNIGLRGPSFSILTLDSPWSLLPGVNERRIERVAVIVVDAKPRSAPKLDRSPSPPSILDVLNASASNPMENYSFDSVDLVREQFKAWDSAASNFERRRAQSTQRCRDLAQEICSGEASCREQRCKQCLARFWQPESRRPPHPDLYRVHVQFDALPDGDFKRRVQGIGTQLQLPRADVDCLIQAADVLLAGSPQFAQLLHDMGLELDPDPTLRCDTPAPAVTPPQPEPRPPPAPDDPAAACAVE